MVGSAIADDSVTYKYRENDGTVWFTDRRPNADRIDDFKFLGYHGRPPARESCQNLDAAERAARVSRVETPVARLSARYDIEPRLVHAVISVESCFDPKAVSRVGARGLMQLMPSTGRALGVRDAFDIQQNLRGGIEYLQRMRTRYNGDMRLALAAYNAGPSAVDRHDGIPPYKETRRYVRTVLERWRRLRAGADITNLY